jgi:hypothetical protein
MDPTYAAQAQNAVIDTAGRLAARQGVTNQTTTPIGNVTVTNELEATANGTQLVFSGTFANAPVVPGTVTITAGAVTATDSGGAGVLSGVGVITGTINYVTGVFTITYLLPPTNGTQILATYNYTPVIKEFFEYNAGGGVYQNIITWNGGASNNINNPPAGSIAGTASLVSGTWFFQNFNNKMIGFQNGQKPCVYTNGTGTLNTIVESSGTWPLSSGVGAACFGRVWSVSQDNNTITYSGLLDETDVGNADAGVINMQSIWSNGTDTITAIFAFNAALVVCGLKHIVMFTDGRGSLLGMDPTQAYVFDMLTGTGCLSQWTAQAMGETDYLFLSPNGVQSLQRLTTDRNNPTDNLSKYVRDSLLAQVTLEIPNTLQATYNPLTGFYIMNCPKSGTIWCLDQRRRYQDDIGTVCAVVTTWTMTATALGSTHNNLTYIARTAGKIGLYTGNLDEGTSYTYSWLSPWLSFGQQGGPMVSVHLKMMKRYEAIVFTGGNATMNMNWQTDFSNSTPFQASFNLVSIGNNSQYGIGQYGIAQYGGGAGTTIVKYDSRARGQYYQLGITISVSSVFALQQVQFAGKIGRVA